MRRLFRANCGARPRPTTIRSHRSAGPWRVESLEPRTLLAFAPQGPEFQVNTFTTGNQDYPSVSADADGDYVVAWHSDGQDGSFNGVYAQRYNATGVAQGGEFRVNTFTAGGQSQPSVVADADGDFVVAWQSVPQDGSGSGIYAQRYNAAGVAQGGEFRVNTFTTSDQRVPSVAADADGDFVVAWQSLGQDGSGNGVYAQRYNAAGVAQGGEFRVNTFTTGNQSNPSVAADADGDFVVAWESYAQDGSFNGVYAQRYNATGLAEGAEFRVNTFTTGYQSQPSVAADADGDFVIAWQSDAQDGSSYGVYAQRYNAAGAAQVGEFRVNTFTTGGQFRPSVAADADGDFVVAWESFGQDGSGPNVYAQRYNAAGVAQRGEFRINTFTADRQFNPSVVADADGDLVVAWQSGSQDGSSFGVFGQRFDETTDTAGPIVSGVVAAGDSIAPGERLVSAVSEFTIHFSENLSTLGGVSGANSPTNPANWRLTRNGVDVSSVVQSITFGFNAAANKHEAVLTLSSPQGEGSYVLTAKGNLRDLAGNPLDGNLDGAPGGDSSLPFVIQFPVNVGPEFRVNTFTTSDQSQASVATDADGDFVVSWHSAGQDGSGFGIYAQRYNAAGVAQGGEFRVNTFTTSIQSQPSVAMDADGDFVVAWNSLYQDGSSYGVYAQRYNAAGVAQGGEFRVNTFTTSIQSQPSVAADADGDFVVAWNSAGQDGSFYGVYAQRYNAAGVAQGGEFRVNTFTAGNQSNPSVAADADGDFVVAWDSYAQDGSLSGVYAQRYNSAGVAQGGEFRVNTFTTGYQSQPSVAADADGDVVVAWHSDAQDGSNLGVYAQRYNATGVAQGGEFRVNTFTTGVQSQPSVAADADGDFVVAWTSSGQDGSGYGVFAQRYGANDAPAHVTAVFVAGSLWSTAFKNSLAARGLGEAAFGYSVPAGPAQLDVLPWSGIDRISMRFDRRPPAVGTSLQLRGVNVPTYLIAGFVYDEPTHTGTWSLAAPIVRDKLMLDLDGPPGGLDGDWTNGADAFPSGDGTPGGDFRFRLNILSGDVNRDGRVSAADLLDVRRRMRRSTASPGAGATEYTPFHDLTADGSIGAADEATLRRNFLRTLPPGEPTATATAVASAAVRRRGVPITRGIFADQSIIT